MASRPTIAKNLDTVNPKAEVTISIPPGWFTNISAVSRKTYPQLMSIKSSIAALNSKFVSKSNVVMIDTTPNQNRTFPIKPHDKPIDVVLAFYYSENVSMDEKKIEDKAYASSKVLFREGTTLKAEELTSDIPDYHTFFVCVENLTEQQQKDGEPEYDDLVATVSLIKTSVAGPPPRPSRMDDYLKHYDTAFLIDDSASMKRHGRWASLKDALVGFSEIAISHDAAGISFSFLNSDEKFDIKGDHHDKYKAIKALSMVGPHGQCTPTGKRVAEYMRDFLAKLDRAAQNGYSHIKPLDLVCFTDGCPNDEDPDFDLDKVLVDMSAHFREKKHHAEWMSIKFVQIGAEMDAREALIKLTYHHPGGMVQAFPHDKSGSGISAEKIEKILLAQ